MNKFERGHIVRRQPLEKPKERSIWKKLGLALAATPMVSFVGIIIITLFGALDDAITTIQSAGHWWMILIVAYILSFIYFLFEPRVRRNRRNRDRKKMVDVLIIYWLEQLQKRSKSVPSDEEIELVHEMILERVGVSTYHDPELWNRRFPDEKYSVYLFDVVDNFMAYWENQKEYWKSLGNK